MRMFLVEEYAQTHKAAVRLLGLDPKEFTNPFHDRFRPITIQGLEDLFGPHVYACHATPHEDGLAYTGATPTPTRSYFTSPTGGFRIAGTDLSDGLPSQSLLERIHAEPTDRQGRAYGDRLLDAYRSQGLDDAIIIYDPHVEALTDPKPYLHGLADAVHRTARPPELYVFGGGIPQDISLKGY